VGGKTSVCDTDIQIEEWVVKGGNSVAAPGIRVQEGEGGMAKWAKNEYFKWKQNLLSVLNRAWTIEPNKLNSANEYNFLNS